MRTYDVASLRISPDELMCEVAGFFGVRAVALVKRVSGRAADLVSYGAGDGLNGDDRFLPLLKTRLSDAALDGLTETRFSVVQQDTGSSAYVMIFEQPQDALPLDGSQQQLAAVLLPHLIRSLRVARSLARSSQDTVANLEAVKERLEPATVILGPDGRVTEINAKANSLIAACSTIKQANGCIEISDPAVASKFKQDLGGLLAATSTQPFFVRLMAGSDENGLILLVRQRREPTPGAVIYLRSILTRSDMVSDCFGKQFGLTPKEQRLANGLIQGKDVQQLATEFHVSAHTLRTQIKVVFRKTKVNTQAALLVLMFGETLTNFEHQ